MITFLYGENSYQSYSHLNLQISKSRKDGYRITVINADDSQNISEIFNTTQAMSFFSQKDLLVIKRLFKNKSKKLIEEVTTYLPQVAKTSDIIIWEEGEADKRTKLFKTIYKEGECIEYKNLKEGDLVKWIVKEFDKSGIKIKNELASYMIERQGNNQFLLHTEIDKLINYTKSLNLKDISKEIVDEMVGISKEESIWELIDKITMRDRKSSLLILENLVNDIGSYSLTLGMIARQLRIMYMINLKRDMPQSMMASELKIHPFVLRKTYRSALEMGSDKISKAYEKLIGLEKKIKTSLIDPKLGLDLFILSL